MRPSVVIPIWTNDEESLQVTKACIESFKQTEKWIPELILVDNASKVGGGYFRDEATIYLRFPQNVGYTVAMNAGIKVATGDLIALANNDIRVPVNWERVSREILASDENIATVHPRMTDYEVPFEFGEQVADVGKERWCQNSFVVTSRSFLDVLKREERNDQPNPGLFDENYGIGGGGDDWDFGFRVRKLGKQCYIDKTCFQHMHSFSLKKLGAEREKIAQQNDDYFLTKWGVKKEDLFAQQYPEQMQQDYRKGFEI